MNDELVRLKEKLEGIKALKQELLVRFAMMTHLRGGNAPNPTLELLAAIRRINQEIEAIRPKAQACPAGSADEEFLLGQIRELEDERFQLLSQVSGNQLSGYNILAPRY